MDTHTHTHTHTYTHISLTVHDGALFYSCWKAEIKKVFVYKTKINTHTHTQSYTDLTYCHL